MFGLVEICWHFSEMVKPLLLRESLSKSKSVPFFLANLLAERHNYIGLGIVFRLRTSTAQLFVVL